MFRDRRGIAAIEFALIAPMVILGGLGTADLVVWMRTWMRTEQSTFTSAQILSSYRSLYASDFTGVIAPIAALGLRSGAFSCPTGGIVVSGISNTSGTAAVGWQWSSGSCITSNYVSGSSLNLPGGYTPPSGDGAILVEMFTTSPEYAYAAGLMKTTGLSNIRTYAVIIPRIGTLPTYTAGTRPSS